ncbi:MAG: Ig-like domain-containing protein, partial [Acidobacteriota bacterium]
MFRSLQRFIPLTLPTLVLCSFFLLGATLAADSVTLHWDPNSESDLAGYNVYRSNTPGSGYSKLNSNLLSSTSYTDSSLTPGSTYYYVCTAVNSSGLESGYSNQVSYTSPSPNTPPVAVNDSSTITVNSSAYVNVTANDNDPDGDPLTVSQVGSAAHGMTAILSSSIVRYTPSTNYVGMDSFTYTIS